MQGLVAGGTAGSDHAKLSRLVRAMPCEQLIITYECLVVEAVWEGKHCSACLLQCSCCADPRSCHSSHRFCCLQVVKGADVVLIIERSKTDKNDKPFEDIKIMNISVNTTEAA